MQKTKDTVYQVMFIAGVVCFGLSWFLESKYFHYVLAVAILIEGYLALLLVQQHRKDYPEPRPMSTRLLPAVLPLLFLGLAAFRAVGLF